MRWPWKRAADEPEAFPTTAAPGEPEAFVDSGRTFFAEAWAAPSDDEGIEAFAVQTAEERQHEDELTRQLSRRPRGPVLLLAGVVMVGGVAAFGTTQGWFAADDAAGDDDGVVFEAAIASPQDPRSYAGGPFSATADLTAALDRGIRQSAAGPELLTQVPEALPEQVSFTPVLWGNRLQILVSGPVDMVDSACLVIALVAEDLRALDVAARGDGCAAIHGVTGDRSSCAGEGVELVEVWPPLARTDLLEPPEAVERVRVRIEQDGDEPGDRISIRGELDLRGVDLLDLPVLGGEPGDVLPTDLGGAARTCTLLDRAQVEVRVL